MAFQKFPPMTPGELAEKLTAEGAGDLVPEEHRLLLQKFRDNHIRVMELQEKQAEIQQALARMGPELDRLKGRGMMALELLFDELVEKPGESSEPTEGDEPKLAAAV